jgi:FkbM family methyltransferase
MQAPGATLDFSFAFAAARVMLDRKDIYFIEIGANDGVSNDPVFPFIRDHGWAGLMVEPLPHAFHLLEENMRPYPGVTPVLAALSDSDGERALYTVKVEQASFEKSHQFSSFSREVIEKQTQFEPGIAKIIEQTMVPTLSWPSLLARTGGATVDVLQVDAEGYDAEIIRMIDFSNFRPRLIQYEHCNLTKADQEDIARRLLALGYKLAMTPLDVIALRD